MGGNRVGTPVHVRIVRWVGVSFVFVLVLPLTTSFEASATDLRPWDLASPMTVAPGMEISIVLNNSPALFFSGSEPGQSIQFRGVRNGVDPWGPYGPFGSQGAIAGAIRLEPGVWNLTFQSGGRIALGVELSELCPNSNSSISRGGVL